MIISNNDFLINLQIYLNRVAISGGSSLSDEQTGNLFRFMMELSRQFDWDDIFDIWTCRSGQNADGAVSVLGMKNDTDNDLVLTNSPSWGSEGIVVDGVDQHLIAGNGAHTTNDYYAVFALVKPVTGIGDCGVINSEDNNTLHTARVELTANPTNDRFIVLNDDTSDNEEAYVPLVLDKWNLVYGMQDSANLLARTYHNSDDGTLQSTSGILANLTFGGNSALTTFFKGTLGFAMALHRDTEFTEADGKVIRTALKRHLFSDVTIL